jgi:hypothetical protein
MWHKMATVHGNRLAGCLFTHFSVPNRKITRGALSQFALLSGGLTCCGARTPTSMPCPPVV